MEKTNFKNRKLFLSVTCGVIFVLLYHGRVYPQPLSAEAVTEVMEQEEVKGSIMKCFSGSAHSTEIELILIVFEDGTVKITGTNPPVGRQTLTCLTAIEGKIRFQPTGSKIEIRYPLEIPQEASIAHLPPVISGERAEGAAAGQSQSSPARAVGPASGKRTITPPKPPGDGSLQLQHSWREERKKALAMIISGGALTGIGGGVFILALFSWAAVCGVTKLFSLGEAECKFSRVALGFAVVGVALMVTGIILLVTGVRKKRRANLMRLQTGSLIPTPGVMLNPATNLPLPTLTWFF